MTLIVNIGNTNISCGLFENGTWIEHRRFSTDGRKTADEYYSLFRTSFEDGKDALAAVTRLAVSTVVPELRAVFKELGTRLLGHPPFFVEARSSAGLTIAIDDPGELGTDLLADAAAGYDRCRTSCIVVDFGTAISFTAVDKGGVVRGAAIAPGFEAAVTALSSGTARLPRVSLDIPAEAIGTNTTSSIRSGIVFGYAGLVESLVERMKRELEPPVTVLATGGNAKVLEGIAACFDIVDPWITLDGIRLIAEREGFRP